MLSQLPDGTEIEGPEAALMKLEGRYEFLGDDKAFKDWRKTFTFPIPICEVKLEMK